MKQHTHQILNQSEKKEFSEIQKKEIKKFLSMDLIERMIRVEQKVSAHFKKYIPYNKTEFYLSLTEKERDNFEKYLKNKKIKSFLKVSAFFILSVFLILQGIKITGSAIREDLTFSLIDLGIFFFATASFIILVSVLFSNMKRRERFDDHISVLENTIYKARKI